MPEHWHGPTMEASDRFSRAKAKLADLRDAGPNTGPKDLVGWSLDT